MRPGTRSAVLVALSLFTSAGVAGWADDLRAQPRGRVVLTQKPPPANAGPAAVNRFLKKNGATVLERQPGKRSWEVYVFVHLKLQPSAATLALPQNGGRLHLAFYRRVRTKWLRDNVDEVTYRAGVTVMKFPFKITPSLGLTQGAPYQLRVTVLDARNRESVLAVGHFKLK